ncbi:PEBP family protein [Sphingomonas sp. LH128]|nr:PEBP family protein [Sphingomonas sp. LH128]
MLAAAQGHVIAKGSLVGRYRQAEKPPKSGVLPAGVPKTVGTKIPATRR